MKFFYRIIADTICLIHLFVVSIALFGWLIPKLQPFYIATLIITLLSDLAFGYCILSKWEFDIRKKIDQSINYDFAWTTYYTRKFTKKNISNSFYKKSSLIFIIFSLLINLYFILFFI